MKKLLLIFMLLVPGFVWAQRAAEPLRLKDAVAVFPGSQLQLKTNGPVSIDVNQGARAAYEKLAEIAGLNIVVDPDFRDGSMAPFRIENADVLQAFDLLSAQTGSFVEVMNSNTIIVAQDNQQKRRDYQFMVLKTFYLPSGTTPQRMTEAITALRSTLLARYLFTSPTAKAIVMRDTPNRISRAEEMIGLSMPMVAGTPSATMGEMFRGGHILKLEGGVVLDSAPARAGLKLSATGPFSFDIKDNTRTIFETLAGAAGLDVIFDADFRSLDAQPFKVDNLDILDAIDVLALKTRTFWEPVDSRTILVTGDNQSKRRDFENVLVKTFYVPNATQPELTEIVTGLRTLLNTRYLAAAVDTGAVVMRDTPDRLALAESIISDLGRSGGVTSAAGFPSGTDGGFLLNRRAAQTIAPLPPLQFKVRGPFSFDANDGARATYEAIAGMAGLRIAFDNRFRDLATVQFRLHNVNIADALDFLSLQTGNIWQMMDSDTILVAPDSQTVRADLLPRVTKTIRLTKSARNVDEIVTALRIILNARQISTLDNAIVMQDTAENVAFAEKIVSDLERPGTR